MTDREIILYGCNEIIFKSLNNCSKEGFNYASFISEVVINVFNENDIDSLCDFISGIFAFVVNHTNDVDIIPAKKHALQLVDDIQKEYSNIVKGEGF